jgi:hypothetical protein
MYLVDVDAVRPAHADDHGLRLFSIVSQVFWPVSHRDVLSSTPVPVLTCPWRTRPGMACTPWATNFTVSRIPLTRSRYPTSPIATSAAQQAAERAPGREPAMVGVM